MNKHDDDGLEWLRIIRRQIADECGNDVHAMSEYYRAAAARIPHKSYRAASSPKRAKRKDLRMTDGPPPRRSDATAEAVQNDVKTLCRVANHVDRKKSAEIPNMLVDTGAEFTWIHAATLEKIGVKREKKDYTFVMASGQNITRAVGFAIIRVGDALTTDEVIFGEPGDLQILGARTLEGMNLRVDPRAKKLVAGGPILAAPQTALLTDKI